MKLILFFISVLLITTNLSVFGDEQSTRDVGFVNKYMISTDGQDFKITFGANFRIISHTFSASDRMIQFDIQTGLEEGNIGEVIIPRELLDGEFTVLLDNEKISHKLSNTTKTSVISFMIDGKGKYTLDIIATNYLEIAPDKPSGGGCLIATAAFNSELSPQVQLLREIRDGKVMTTQSGAAFMNGFNQFYNSFSPTIADYERENTTFKEVVKLALIPLLASLTLLQYVDINSDGDMLSYGIGIILLNIVMYFAIPAVMIMKIRKNFCK